MILSHVVPLAYLDTESKTPDQRKRKSKSSMMIVTRVRHGNESQLVTANGHRDTLPTVAKNILTRNSPDGHKRNSSSRVATSTSQLME